ncbi:hypothetical protein [Moorena sp. SIOASIH]|nr:hypothetical protein [Moorena sp. SIOASIH]
MNGCMFAGQLKPTTNQESVSHTDQVNSNVFTPTPYSLLPTPQGESTSPH